MDKKLIFYIGLAGGVLLIILGGGLLYLKEKSIKKIAVKNPKKVEVVISTSASKLHIANKTDTAEIKSELNIPQKRKIAFHYRSSKPKTVSLVGDFNRWNRKANPMKQGANFVWETMLTLAPGEYKYAFLVDGKRINDPSNKKTVRTKTGKASVLVVKPLQ